MSETVSIVIPTFNRAGMLPVAIDSALNQTKACEVIVVDHGSTDNTPKVAEAYGDRILYIRRRAPEQALSVALEQLARPRADVLQRRRVAALRAGHEAVEVSGSHDGHDGGVGSDPEGAERDLLRLRRL